MNPPPHIVRLSDLPDGIEGLRAEAAAEGFRFMDKLVAEWRNGTNRFARPGEVFLGALWAENLVAVGGLNQDPYADQADIGRLRHLYVRGSARRSGVGSVLVRQLLQEAPGMFHSVRLRTDTWEAAIFYVSLGFCPVHEDTATHIRLLRPT